LANGRSAQNGAAAQQWFRDGLRLHNQGRLLEAEARYRKTLDLDRNHLGALHLLGVLSAATGRLTQAANLLRRAAWRDPSSAQVLIDLAMTLVRLGRADEALTIFDRAVSLQPGLFAAHFHRAAALTALDRIQEAVASYDRAIAAKPDSAEAFCNRGAALLDVHRLDDALASLDQAIALNPGMPDAHNNRGLALAELGRCDEAIAGYDRAIALQPHHAAAHANRGNALRQLGRLDEAVAACDAAIRLSPDHAGTHNNRGVALFLAKRFEDALASHDRAIALKPNSAAAHNNRGNVLGALDRAEEAIASFDSAIAIDPAYAEAFNNRGNALRAIGQRDEALASYDAAIALQPDFHEAIWNKALELLSSGKMSEGWKLYEARRALRSVRDRRDLQRPQWTGRENLTGRTILLHHEQGFGDTIQFCRYAPLVRSLGARVILSVQGPLSRLLRTLDPGIEIIGADAVPQTFDFHCPLMSLPRAFRTRLDSIPSAEGYLSADPTLAALWNERLPSRTSPRVGLAWSGAPGHRNDRNRSIALRILEPLLTANVDWVCLQTEVRESDRETFDNAGRLGRFAEAPADFADTAAVIANLDLVITIDSSVAHLSGALGKPAWVLLPFVSDFRWLIGREDSPWYASLRLFRQQAFSDWPSVIARVGDELGRWLDADRPPRSPSPSLAGGGLSRIPPMWYGSQMH
jgi:tetratricopeptide (TPR) repeat protein